MQSQKFSEGVVYFISSDCIVVEAHDHELLITAVVGPIPRQQKEVSVTKPEAGDFMERRVVTFPDHVTDLDCLSAAVQHFYGDEGSTT
jgi:hypothetical protein